MGARCWLHIGVEKTGSTTIQKYLARNRGRLGDRGYLYPRTPAGMHTHLGLTAYALDEGKSDSARRALGLLASDRIASFRSEFAQALRREVAESGASTLLLSNEHLGARLRAPGEIARMKSLCDSIALETRVIVYIRNQTDFLVASYQQYVAGGGARTFAFAGAPVADYAALLASWSAAFGRENLVVCRFEQSRFGGGDLLTDFARRVGFDPDGLVPVPASNVSLDAAGMEFLLAWNRRFPPADAAHGDYVRRALVALLRSRRKGARYTIPVDAANAIEAAFRPSNERVAREFFAREPGPLFSPAVSVRPAGELARRKIGLAGALRIAVLLLPAAAYLALVQWLRKLRDAARPSHSDR